MANKALINLHEELFNFLMNYRRESKYTDSPTFLFRPLDDKDALSEGRWFYDWDEGVILYFLIGEDKSYCSNIRLEISIEGPPQIVIEKNSKQGAKVQEFDDFFWEDISKIILEAHNQNYTNSANGFFYIIIYRGDNLENYWNGLLGTLDILYFIIRKLSKYQKQDKKLPISLISEEDFQASLAVINNYRRERKTKAVYLNGFSIKNYQGIKEAVLEDLPNQPNWIFLTGENGFGKTSLLRAIAAGLYGDAEDIILPKNKETKIILNYSYQSTQNTEINVQNNTEYPLFFRTMPMLATYGPSRLELQAQGSHGQEAKNSTATYSLFNTDGILKNIEAELAISYYDAPQKYEAICEMLVALIPSLAKVELDKKNRRILYYEKAKSEEGEKVYEAIEYQNLAAGVRSIVAMAGDIFLRLSQAREKLMAEYHDKNGLEEPIVEYVSYNAQDLFGIVIIDELDLHLHPKWQRELPGLLSKVFPKVQFIASTHSPIPLLGAPEGAVFLKVDRTLEEGITVKRLYTLEKEISNLLPNSILTSPIFDMEALFPVTHKPDTAIETADFYSEILADKVLEEELKKLAQSFKFPENLKKKKDEEGK